MRSVDHRPICSGVLCIRERCQTLVSTQTSLVAVLNGMETVRKIEAVGSASGKVLKEVRIVKSGELPHSDTAST